MKSLIIKNLILIEEAHIQFKSGFTVITGETGGGKTALIEAIRLLIGERADVSKLRKGCDKGLVQGVFESSPHIEKLFEEAGLLWEDELIITRELNCNGKSRAFVCGQQVPMTFLQQLGEQLVDHVGQHATMSLKSSQTQRAFLDHYGKIDTKPFYHLWEEEKELAEKLQKLTEKALTSERQRVFLQAQFEELESADVKEGEFESLFEEYELLASSQELLCSLQQMIDLTDQAMGSAGQLVSFIVKQSKSHIALQEPFKLAESASVSLNELYAQLEQLQSRIEGDPGRLTFLEERLKLLNQLKKKYGADVVKAKKDLEGELETLNLLNESILSTENQLKEVKKKTLIEAQNLTQQRQIAAAKWGKELTHSLRALNIPHAKVDIEVVATTRTTTGEDEIRFWLQANPGEKPALLKDSTSGGELSRLFFCIKTALAIGSTMVFDEVDANVGGETATIMGQKLKELGKNKQVLCITHFPQVAAQADHHFRVYKEEKKDRTVSRIDLLSSNEKETELLRMFGGSLVTIVT